MRKNLNYIWKILKDNGVKISLFKDIANAQMKHFEDIFEEPLRSNIGKVVAIASFFPSLVNEEQN